MLAESAADVPKRLSPAPESAGAEEDCYELLRIIRQPFQPAVLNPPER